jgi:hypothetical protein
MPIACSENHAKHISTHCGRNTDILNFKVGDRYRNHRVLSVKSTELGGSSKGIVYKTQSWHFPETSINRQHSKAGNASNQFHSNMREVAQPRLWGNESIQLSGQLMSDVMGLHCDLIQSNAVIIDTDIQ